MTEAFEFYDTKDMAQACKVRPQQAAKWLKTGYLGLIQGFKKPGTNQWLIRSDHFREFQERWEESIKRRKISPPKVLRSPPLGGPA